MTFVIKNLSFERNERLLFRNLNCVLSPGELLQIHGENGSGKSTLLRIIAGLIEPLSGEILWNEKSILVQRDIYQHQLQYVGHQNGLKPQLTVQENLKLFCALNNISSDSMQPTIDTWHLNHLLNKFVHQLSAGQARRVALARLFLRSATLWILDEPTTGLDTNTHEIFMQALNHHLENQGMAVVATHQELASSGVRPDPVTWSNL